MDSGEGVGGGLLTGVELAEVGPKKELKRWEQR